MQYLKLQDLVRVRTGKDKGKTGKIIQILPEDSTVVVDGVNKMYKNMRSGKKGEKGQRIEFSAPLRTSKVMIVCPKCGKPSRMGIVRDGDHKKRVCKKCKVTID